MSLRKVNQGPFSNGTECEVWVERNCDRCKKNTAHTKCAILRDIVTRMAMWKPISQRTIDICQKADCLYKKERR